MSSIPLYLLKLSIGLSVVYLFYQLALRKLTFYNWNRWYLLIYTAICFCIPFIDISLVLEKKQWTDDALIQLVPSVVQINVNQQSVTFFSWQNILLLVIGFGSMIMLCRLLVQFISFRRLLKKAKLLSSGATKIYQVESEIIPFSFGGSIFINPKMHSEFELKEIIQHEFVHVRQKHSIDIIWGELLCLLNWYNPFAWLIKKSIRQNLEFIADNHVLQNGINKKEYQYLLLKVMGNSQFSLATQFNFSSLKNRITMMNRLKTAKLHTLKFLFLIPLIAVLLIAFRDKMQLTKKQSVLQDAVLTVTKLDTVPSKYTVKKDHHTGDVKKNNGKPYVVILDKNNKPVSKIFLTEWDNNAKHHEELYGKLPPPPPPQKLKPVFGAKAVDDKSPITFSADSAIVFSNGEKIILQGRTSVKMGNNGNSILISNGAEISKTGNGEKALFTTEVDVTDPNRFYVVLDGKETSSQKKFTAPDGSRFKMRMLDKKSAQLKYGESVKKQVLELDTLPKDK